MKFIVTLKSAMVEADDHRQALDKVMQEIVSGEQPFRANVCDMDIGWREYFDVEIRAMTIKATSV